MTQASTNNENPEVLVQRHDGVATILLNRASESNPIGWSLGRGLLAALDEVEDDKTISTIILTGAGCESGGR
jgi:enoyl-CoA hydratase/carnithine racemase